MLLCSCCFHCQTRRLRVMWYLDSQQKLNGLFAVWCNSNQFHSRTEIAVHISEYHKGHCFVSVCLKTPEERAMPSCRTKDILGIRGITVSSVICQLRELINRSRFEWLKYQEGRTQVQKCPRGEGGGTKVGRKEEWAFFLSMLCILSFTGLIWPRWVYAAEHVMDFWLIDSWQFHYLAPLTC